MNCQTSDVVPPFVCALTGEVCAAPDILGDAQWWALDNDKRALIEHRITRRGVGTFEEQEAARAELVNRYRNSGGFCGNVLPLDGDAPAAE